MPINTNRLPCRLWKIWFSCSARIHCPWLWTTSFTIIVMVQYWSAVFLLLLLLWKALRKNWINTSLRWWRWRYGSVEMSDKTGPHLTLIDCKPQRPLWIPKSENWFWNEDSSLKILVFALQQRIKAKLQELPCPFEPEDAQGARAPVLAMIYCLETGKISCFVKQ